MVTALPERGWRCHWCSRRLRRRQGHKGFHCLAEGRREVTYRHLHALPTPVSSAAATPAAPPHLRIHSFDYWETRITRWHPYPKVVN